MKKPILAFSLVFLMSLQLAAQNNKQKRTVHKQATAEDKLLSASPSNVYSFSTFTAAYQPITGTSLTNGLKWDDPNHSVPMGFNFSLYNTNGNTINLWGGSSFSFGDFINDMVFTEGGAMWEDMCDRSYDPNLDSEGDAGGTSNISYTTTGTPGNRICIIQLDNVGFYGENDANGVSTSFVNLQMWFYETSNDIEFRYGNISIPNKAECFSNGTAGFLCGLVDSLDYNDFSFGRSNALNGPHNAPSMVALSANFTEVISGDIESGRVYKFSRAVATNVLKINGSKSVSISPNPAKEILFVNGVLPASSVISVYDVAGKLVLEQINTGSIPVSSLNKGIYLVKIKSTDKEFYSGKLIIAE